MSPFLTKIWRNDSIPHTSTNYLLVRTKVMMHQPIPFHKPNKKSVEWVDDGLFPQTKHPIHVLQLYIKS